MWLPRRKLLKTGVAALVCAPAIIRSRQANAAFASFQATSGLGFPGQAGNLVGYTAAAGYTGSLTAYSGSPALSTSGNTFNQIDFNAGTGGTQITGNNNTFNGCRFQSNQVLNYNTNVTGSTTVFNYCSFTPLASLHTTPPSWPSWPAAGTGAQVTGDGTGYQINGNDGYQYGLHLDAASGAVTADHCDIWGFGNAITWLGTSSTMIISDCWIHDAADAAAQLYHTDGPGYLNGGAAPSNISITHCTIASIGNTNGIAFQASTSGYNNISVTRCYMSGFSSLVDMCHGNGTNLTFTDNIFGTDLPWVFRPIYTDFTIPFSGGNGLWRRNTLHVLPGTSTIGGQTFSWTSADNGKFLFPNSTLSTTDYTG